MVFIDGMWIPHFVLVLCCHCWKGTHLIIGLSHILIIGSRFAADMFLGENKKRFFRVMTYLMTSLPAWWCHFQPSVGQCYLTFCMKWDRSLDLAYHSRSSPFKKPTFYNDLLFLLIYVRHSRCLVSLRIGEILGEKRQLFKQCES